MLHGDKQLREEWERRAATHQNDSRGVLFGGLPSEVNAAIGAWHSALVEKHILPALAEGAYVLDLAAGYGRLSNVVRTARADVILVGIDLSLTYNHLYQKNIGSAVCGDMRSLPFAEATFDRIVAVTGLMYLDSTEYEQATTQIVARLKPGGLALFVDPGAEMIRLLRKLRPSLAQGGTGGEGFGAHEYPHLFRSIPNCTIVGKGGNVFFTLILPLLLLLRNYPKVVSALGRRAVRLDLSCGGWGRFALHRWVAVRRDA